MQFLKKLQHGWWDTGQKTDMEIQKSENQLQEVPMTHRCSIKKAQRD
jgi:hypothetical protein